MTDDSTQSTRIWKQEYQEHVKHRSASPAVLRESHGIPQHTRLSNLQACLHLIKGTVGTGILAMPAATRDAGIIIGPLGILLVGLLIIHAMHMLIESAQHLRQYYQLEEDIDMDYIDTVKYTLRYSPQKFRRYCSWLPAYLRFCLLSAQFGFLSVYLSFVSENTRTMVEFYKPVFKPPLIFYQGLVFLFIMPLSFIKSLQQLAKFSGLANFLAIFSSIISLIYFVTNLRPLGEIKLIQTMETIPMFFGVIVFAFESINIVLPCENKMKNKSELIGYNGVLNLAMIPSVCLFTAVAFYGYLCFGSDIEGSFTYSIPMEPWYWMIVKPMYTISIYISFGLQFFVLFSFLWELTEPYLGGSEKKMKIANIGLRAGSMVLVFILAAIVPHVDLMISLVGSFSGASITLLLPGTLHSVLLWREIVEYGINLSENCIRFRYSSLCVLKLLLIKNICLIIFGIFGAIIGSYTSIVSIIKVLANEDELK